MESKMSLQEAIKILSERVCIGSEHRKETKIAMPFNINKVDEAFDVAIKSMKYCCHMDSFESDSKI